LFFVRIGRIQIELLWFRRAVCFCIGRILRSPVVFFPNVEETDLTNMGVETTIPSAAA
jgi:hypothetical protein